MIIAEKARALTENWNALSYETKSIYTYLHDVQKNTVENNEIKLNIEDRNREHNDLRTNSPKSTE